MEDVFRGYLSHVIFTVSLDCQEYLCHNHPSSLNGECMRFSASKQDVIRFGLRLLRFGEAKYKYVSVLPTVACRHLHLSSSLCSPPLSQVSVGTEVSKTSTSVTVTFFEESSLIRQH